MVTTNDTFSKIFWLLLSFVASIILSHMYTILPLLTNSQKNYNNHFLLTFKHFFLNLSIKSCTKASHCNNLGDTTRYQFTLM